MGIQGLCVELCNRTKIRLWEEIGRSTAEQDRKLLKALTVAGTQASITQEECIIRNYQYMQSICLDTYSQYKDIIPMAFLGIACVDGGRSDLRLV